jgi:hypothetical protein
MAGNLKVNASRFRRAKVKGLMVHQDEELGAVNITDQLFKGSARCPSARVIPAYYIHRVIHKDDFINQHLYPASLKLCP